MIAPAMNPNMFAHPAVQMNIERLKSWGVKFVEPEEGLVACGDQGKGRLADINLILRLLLMLSKVNKIIVTGGPTREWFDPIRYISNASSRKMELPLQMRPLN